MKIYRKSFSKIFENFFRQTKGQKRLFLLSGIINIIITNLFLQLFLSTSYISTFLATLFSQLINMLLGYFIYSKLVFKKKDIFIKKFIIKYLLLMTIIWLSNSYYIHLLEFAGFDRNMAALFLIPLLAFISFLVQKFLIFNF